MTTWSFEPRVPLKEKKKNKNKNKNKKKYYKYIRVAPDLLRSKPDVSAVRLQCGSLLVHLQRLLVAPCVVIQSSERSQDVHLPRHLQRPARKRMAIIIPRPKYLLSTIFRKVSHTSLQKCTTLAAAFPRLQRCFPGCRLSLRSLRWRSWVNS
ncbi:hypothetical protein EYF80_042101 [Liparis tanakae]|uniref:Uncharacterized protein n=1 Tax=Liparis tanakae TaxID=230148 RepID=A0A4Z2G325_9TELE|nr:hypothetical protein EYF80_042101 [Liparis tanakae]